MAAPIIGLTAKLSVNDGASNVQATFDSLVSVSLPGFDTGEEAFAYLSQGDRIMRKLPKMVDQGSISFESIFSKADYQRITALKGKRYITGSTAITWVVTTPDEDGSTATLTPLKFTFDGFVKKLDPTEMTPDGMMKFKCEVTISGPITEADGTNAAGNQ